MREGIAIIVGGSIAIASTYDNWSRSNWKISGLRESEDLRIWAYDSDETP